MTLKILISIVFIFLNFQKNGIDNIEWSETRKLNWADFAGSPEDAAFYVASTNSGIHFTYSFKTKNGITEVTSKVSCIFLPDKSWFKPGKVSDYVLRHEQTHFDISELFARKLRKKIANAKFTKNLKQEIESLYKANEIERQTMQAKFDKDTDHSKKENAELQWETFVELQLKAHDDWK